MAGRGAGRGAGAGRGSGGYPGFGAGRGASPWDQEAAYASVPRWGASAPETGSSLGSTERWGAVPTAALPSWASSPPPVTSGYSGYYSQAAKVGAMSGLTANAPAFTPSFGRTPGLGAPAESVDSMMAVLEAERRAGMQELEDQWNKLHKEKESFTRRVKQQDAKARQDGLVTTKKEEGEGLVSQGSNLVGKVKTYNSTKRFGFLVCDEYTKDIFVYQTHLVGRIALQSGEQVVFDLVTDNGRPQARNVRPYRSDGGAGPELMEGDDDGAGMQIFPKGTIVEVTGHPLDEWNGKQGSIQGYDRNQKTFSVDMGKLKLNLKPEYLRFVAKGSKAEVSAPRPEKEEAKADGAKTQVAEVEKAAPTEAKEAAAPSETTAASATNGQQAAAASTTATATAAAAASTAATTATTSQDSSGGVRALEFEVYGSLKESREKNTEHELSASANEEVCVSHTAGPWLYGYIIKDPTRAGYILRDHFVPRPGSKLPPSFGQAPPPPPAAPEVQQPAAAAAATASAAAAAEPSKPEAAEPAPSPAEEPKPEAEKAEAEEAKAEEVEAEGEKAPEDEKAEGGAPGLLVGQAALDWLWSGRKEAPLKGAAKFKAEQEGSKDGKDPAKGIQ